MPVQFDHAVIAAESLEEGAAYLADVLGVAPGPGGAHPTMATHNRLIGLGPGEYLELIAIDRSAPAPAHPRWFGLDAFSGPPRPVAWMVRTHDLDALALPRGAGTVTSLARGDLRWRLTVPAGGMFAFDGIFPGVLEWQGRGAADGLPDSGLRLTGIALAHPAPAALSAALPLIEPRLSLRQGPPSISFTIQTPKGPKTL